MSVFILVNCYKHAFSSQLLGTLSHDTQAERRRGSGHRMACEEGRHGQIEELVRRDQGEDVND